MNSFSINQFAVFIQVAIIVSVVLMVLFRLRLRFGLTPFYITLGVFQPIQVFLASSIYAEILPGVVVSPGSVIMFTASLFAILLVYIREDALEARKAIYGIMFANLTMSLLMIIFGLQLRLPDTLNFLNLSSDLFNQNARVTIAGTITLFADVLLIIFVYEAIWRWFTKRHFFCIYLTMALILVFDTLLFTTGAFLGQSNYLTILTSGVIGKLFMALPFALAMTLYLYYGEPAKREPNSFEDIFDTLSYRQKFEIARHRGEKAEKGLQVIEDRFQQLFEHSPVALLEEDFSELLTYLEEIKKKGVSDFRDYFDNNPNELQTCAQKVRINNLNQETLRLHKATNKKELLGNLNNIFTEKSYDTFKEEVIALTEGKLEFEGSGQVKTLDGDIREVSLKLQLQKDSQIALLATTDITQRKRAERELQESNRRLMTVLDSIDAFIYIADMQTYEILFINKYGMEIWGDIEGQLCWKAIQKDQEGPCAFCTNDKLLTQDGAPTGVYQWEFQNSISDRWYDCRDTVIPWTDGRLVRMEIATDITARKNLESQLIQTQKMESVGQLAGGVAHDFNNMLSVILGYADLALEDTAPEDRLHKYLQEISNAARRSSGITRQLLAFARKQIISPRVLDLNETIEGMLKMLRRLIGEDIDLSWHPDSDLKPVFMDQSQLDQILANLCVNARDAIGGVGKLIVETKNVRLDENYCADRLGFSAGDFVTLAVSDDGCGMDKETVDKVFEPFFTTKEMGEGTGLGLSTVYGIVKQNNGFINVYSEPGQGTTFKIYLQLHKGESQKAEEIDVTEIERSQGETVLIVEDETSILKLAQKILLRLGYTVLVAETPGKAVALAEKYEDKINLLLTDVIMPEMNGRELAKKLHKLYPNLKVLFMSGYTANIIAHHGVLEEEDFIQKPFSKRDLAVNIRRALDRVKE